MEPREKLDWLRTLDWEKLSAKLLNYAISKGRRYGWEEASMLPKGGSLIDIVHKVVEKAFRDLDETPEDETELTRVLINRVSSSLYNHSKYPDEDIELSLIHI